VSAVAALLLVLAAGAQEPGALEAQVRHGFPADQPLPARPEGPAAAALAWDLAQLVPARVSGRTVAAAERAAAVGRVVAALDATPEAFAAVVFARLRGNLDGASAAGIGARLRAGAGAWRDELLGLLMSAPLDAAEDELVAFVLDETQPDRERGAVAEHLLLARGRVALERLRPAIHPAAAPRLLRRVYAGWRAVVAPEDLPWLEELAREGQEFSAQYALQLWALNETDSARRWEVYRLALQADPSFRQVAVDALGRQGPDARIADAMRELLDTGDTDQRRLARRMLPVFDGPEALWEAYQERASALSPSARAEWMAALAGSPLPEARREAAQWLAEHGRVSGGIAMAVTRLLSGDQELDPFLPALLRQSELPDRVLWPLALLRSESSEAARDLLRERIAEGDGLMQRQAVQYLAAAGQDRDLRMIADLARSTSVAPGSRAAALEALADAGRAEPLLEEWLDAPPPGYEVAEAFVRAVFRDGTDAQLERLLTGLEGGLGMQDEDERRGLRVVAREEAGRRGGARAADFVVAALGAELRAVAQPQDGWPSFYEFARGSGALQGCLDALLFVAASLPPEEVEARVTALDIEGVAGHALCFAAHRIAPLAPRAAAAWFRAIPRESLADVDQLRATGMEAWSLDPHPEAASAYRELLGWAPVMHRYARPLAEVFSPAGTAWTLFHDRIEERSRVHRARLLAGAARLDVLRPLLEGWCEAQVLADAAALAEQASADQPPAEGAAQASDAPGRALALEFARRRARVAPLSALAHADLAELAGRAGAPEEAVAAWQAALRTSVPGSPMHSEASAALAALAAERGLEQQDD